VLFCDVFVMILNFIIDKGGSMFVMVIYDKTIIFVIKSDFL
jgi:hypothetical protein